MATLTIRNLPEDLVACIKAAARGNGHSMEQEARLSLTSRYAPRAAILARVQERWDAVEAPSATELDRWRKRGRPDGGPTPKRSE